MIVEWRRILQYGGLDRHGTLKTQQKVKPKVVMFACMQNSQHFENSVHITGINVMYYHQGSP